MIWPRTRGATPITFACTIASSVRGWCSMMLQTQSVSTTTPAIAAMLMMSPTGLRHPSVFTGLPGGAIPGFCAVLFEEVVPVESSIGISVFEEKQPDNQGEENHQAE